jgi:hypothetical protein
MYLGQENGWSAGKPVRKYLFEKKQHLPVAIQGRNLKPLMEIRNVGPVPILMT